MYSIDMHWIQKHIVRRLSTSDVLRYKELKPENIEGNMFMYHLGQLKKCGLIERMPAGYTLTTAGKTFVSGMSLRAAQQRKQPKIVVMLDCKNNKAQQLLFKWSRQPYLGLVSLPFSKLHYGMSAQEFAQSELEYRSNLIGEPTYQGDVYIRSLHEDKVVDHVLAHIFSMTNVTGELTSKEPIIGKAFWGDPKTYKSSNVVPGFFEILKLLKTKNQPFFKEVTINIG